MGIQVKFGLLNQLEYRIGDKYRWTSRRSSKKGGRPAGGDMDGEGFAGCRKCDKSFFAVVKIRDDHVVSVLPDFRSRPYGGDAEMTLEMECPHCRKISRFEVDLLFSRDYSYSDYRLMSWEMQREQIESTGGRRLAEGQAYCRECKKYSYYRVTLRLRRRHDSMEVVTMKPDPIPLRHANRWGWPSRWDKPGG